MDYEVKENENTTISAGGFTFKNWSVDNLYEGDYPVERLIEALEVVQYFKKKYPNDEFVLGFDEILRDEICHIFGGSLEEEEEDE